MAPRPPPPALQFDPLSPEQLRGVARLQVADINQRLKERSITMSPTGARRL